MLAINLLKSKAPPRKSLNFVPLLTALGSVILLGIAGFGGVKLYPHLVTPKSKAIVSAPVAPSTNFSPSTLSKSRIIEEVVQDVQNDPDRLSRGRTPIHADLSYPEKINYEALFARTVCELLARVVPEEIGLRSLEIEDFTTIYAVGLGQSRQLVNDLFSTLKLERVELLPPPYSFIKPNGDNGYRFAVSCKAAWGLDLTDPYVDLSLGFLPDRDGIAAAVKNFEKLSSQNGVKLASPLKRTSAAVEGSVRRYNYEYTATGSFVDLVKFLNELHRAQLPCAFKKLSLNAESRSKVVIKGTVVFTARG